MPRTTYRITQRYRHPGDWRDDRKRIVRMYVDYWDGQIVPDAEDSPFPVSAKVALFPYLKDLDECVEVPLMGLSRCVAKKLLNMYEKNEEWFQRNRDANIDGDDDSIMYAMEADPA